MVGHLSLKSSKTSHFIRKSYFYKSLMTSRGSFLSQKNQPQLQKRNEILLFFSFLIVTDCMVYPDSKFLVSNFGIFKYVSVI